MHAVTAGRPHRTSRTSGTLFTQESLVIVLRASRAARALGVVASLVPATLLAQAKPATPAPARPATAGTAGGGTAAAALPPVQALVARYVEAVGGRTAIMNQKSLTMVATFEIPAAGIKADTQVMQAQPDKFTSKITIPGMGEVSQGYDGAVGWSIDPNSGPRLLTGKELEQAKTQADFLAALHDPSRYSVMETVEKTDFETRPAYKVRLVRTGGDSLYEYFDAENGLLLGNSSTVETPMGAINAVSVMKDYRDFGGVKHPASVVQRANGQEFVVNVVSITPNTATPASFELPAAIKALVAPAPAK
jgi:hypothetical protein